MYKNSYVADGATFRFAFAFPVFAETDVRVAVDNIVLSPDRYDVNLNDAFDGGVIELRDIPPINSCLDVFRQIALNRVVDYQPTGRLTPENLNSDFNFIIEALKDLRNIDADLAAWRIAYQNAIDAFGGNDDYGLL